MLMLLWMFAMNVLAAGGSSDTVATVGEKCITAGEFIRRYTFFLERTGTKDNLVVRNNILQVMIFEEAIVQNAMTRQLFMDRAYRTNVEKIKIQSMLGSYYDTLADTMTVSEQELQQTYRRINTKVRARHLYAASYPDAVRLRERLRNGESFGRLALEVFRDTKLKYSGGDLGFFSGGEMDAAFEDQAFTLPLDVISEPVRTEQGYSIIKVEERTVKPLMTEQEYAQKRSRLIMIVKERRRVELAEMAAKNTAKELSPAFNAPAVARLTEAWSRSANISALAVSEAFTGLNRTVIVNSASGTWTGADLNKRMMKISPRHFRRVRNTDDLKELITGLLVQEELLRRADAQHLDTVRSYRDRVANDTIVELITAWSNQVYGGRLGYDLQSGRFTAQKMQKRFEDSVAARYKSSRGSFITPEERTVSEIVVDSFPAAMQIVKKLNGGASFSQLARKYSISPTAVNGGKIGSGPVSSFGSIGEMLFSQRPNTVVGPVQGEGNYVLYYMTDVRPSRQLTFEAVRAEIGEQVMTAWKDAVYKDELNTILTTAGVKINHDVVANISF